MALAARDLQVAVTKAEEAAVVEEEKTAVAMVVATVARIPPRAIPVRAKELPEALLSGKWSNWPVEVRRQHRRV